ncbi:MAG: hypothetical protein KH846_06605 [Leptotrichia wadei]|uniref:hypothetical protein n=1 Tax=Leptotrichia wadei TaxID=157687 RepID=UPI0026EC6819|nr:hypothetical protein [Leptotrichia wadei]MBS6019846.1 hypothetical protein [Leptotrichia wadei]
MEFKEFDKEKMKEELRNDIYNLVYINYEKENGIKVFKNEGNALNLLSESDFENFYKIYIFNNNFMKTIYQFGEDDYRYSEVNSEDFDENTKKFREILIKIKENPDGKKVNRLKVLTGENKITKKEIVQFLEFLGGERN